MSNGRLEALCESLNQDYGLRSFDRTWIKCSAANPGGGVSIFFNPRRINLKAYPCKTRGHEIIAAQGKIPNNTRPFYIIVAYVSTRLKADEYHDLLEALCQIILKIKSSATNPYIILGGVFNRTDIGEAIDDYGDIQVVLTSGTRGTAVLDLCAVNFLSDIKECYNHSPLQADDGSSSDHSFLTFHFRLRHKHEFVWTKYKTRAITDKSEKTFSDELEQLD